MDDIQCKYMTVFYYGVSLYTGETIGIQDNEFNQLLLGFITNYYTKYYKIMDKVFDIRYSKETSTTDNQGNELSKGQQDYFDGSKEGFVQRAC